MVPLQDMSTSDPTDFIEKEIAAEEIEIAAEEISPAIRLQAAAEGFFTLKTPQSSPSKPTTPPTTVKPAKDYEELKGLKLQQFFGKGDGPIKVRTLLSEEEQRQLQHDKLEADVNSALYFLHTSVQEHQTEVALEEQNKHIDKAIAAREAAVGAKREAEKHLDLLQQQRDRAEKGLDAADKQWKGTDWHKLPPTVQKARSDLKRSVVTLLSCVITAQHRVLKYTEEIKNFDQILFQLGASSCSLCGHHLLGNGFESEETSSSSIVIGGGDNTRPIIICDAAEGSGSSSSFGSGESGSCSSADCSQNPAVSIDDGSDVELVDPKGKRPADDNFGGRGKDARY